MNVALRVALAAVGVVVGGLLAVLLPFMLWPGGVAAAIGIPAGPAPPEAVLRAEMSYGLILGAVGAILPATAYRIGYGVAVALVVVGGSAGYWSRHDAVLPLVLAIAAWIVVAGAIRLIQVFLAPRP